MHLTPGKVLLLCVLSQLLGFAIFLRGFLVIKSVIPGSATIQEQSLEPLTCDQDVDTCEKSSGFGALPIPSPYSRLVLVLIDALRSDFVMATPGSQLPRMKFLASLIEEGKTSSYIAKAHPPTVTMPRIKALTSGTIPGFVDVVLNFDSQSLPEDNMISQLKQTGKSLVFYGDDTWLRLFPEAFMRSEGTTSFFVTDYTEVDDNVTNHIKNELALRDWDVLILHYLGLDHIGHLAGPTSPLVPRKLGEMDTIIKGLYGALKQRDTTDGGSTLLVVCGDHGMSDQGSHGGSSVSETNTPLVLIPLDGRSVGGPPGSVTSEVYQIDLVPTLAVLFGTAIPQNSLGVLIPGPMLALPLRAQLQAWYRNSQQLLKVYKENMQDHERTQAFQALQAVIAGHLEWLHQYGNASGLRDGQRLATDLSLQYRSALIDMRDAVADSLINYDMHAMLQGILLLVLSLCGMVIVLVSSPGHPPLLLPSKSGWVFIALMFVGIWFHVTACTGQFSSSLLCQGSAGSASSHLISLGLLLMLSSWVTVIVAYINNSFCLKWIKTKLCSPAALLSSGCVLHTLSLLASSFVEEEHQTWYFFSVTVLLALTTLCVWGLRISSSSMHNDARCMEQRHSASQDKVRTDGMHGSGTVPPMYSMRIWSMFCGILCLIVCRIMRSWNGTGDKWSHLPDVGDWLNRPEHKAILSITVAGSLMVFLVSTLWRKPRHYVYKMLTFLALFGIYCVHTARGALLLPGIYPVGAVYQRCVEARLVYLTLFCFVIHIIARYLFSLLCKLGHPKAVDYIQPNDPHHFCGRCSLLLGIQDCWAMLTLLLMRTHNIPLAIMVVILERLVSKLLRMFELNSTSLTLLYIWMGQACYFYQGNSNSLASVDIAAGYVGVVQYDPVIIGVLMAIATYAAPVYWSLSLLATGCAREQHGHRFGAWVSRSCAVLALSRGLPLAVYPMAVTLQRYHLFVWTVFSPKLLYEGMLTVITSVIILLMMTLKGLYPCKSM